MALQMSYDYQGIQLTAAYHRISDLNYSKKAENVSIVVEIFKDATTAHDGTSNPIARVVYHCNEGNFDTYYSITALDIVNQNQVSQGYDYLKTLPEYRGSVNV